MAKYQDKFTLSPADIDIIERALRLEMSRHVPHGVESPTDTISRTRIREVHQVLGKIHNQKIFYSQVRVPDVPSA